MSRLNYEPFLLVVSAPSGTGKTTVCRQTLARLERIRFSVSHTTRPIRSGEQEGRDYYFVDAGRFQNMQQQGAFLESANVYGNYYGTSLGEVERARDDGVELLVEIDVQGARQIMQKRQDLVSVFILPPSLEIVEARLRSRGSDHEDAIQRRLAEAGKELRESVHYDYWIVNDDLNAAVDDLTAIVRAERMRRSRVSLDRHPLADKLSPKAA